MPYESSVDEFYIILKRKTATQNHIAMALAGLLSEATRPDTNRQRYIDNWSQRYEYDAEGILIDAGAGQDFETEEDAIVAGDNEADITATKLDLLSDVTAFLVGSEYSTLSFGQREALLNRAEGFFKAVEMDGIMDEILGNALAPYVALDVERAALGDDTAARVRRGRYVLDNLSRRALLRGPRERNLRRNLRHAGRMS